MAVEEKTKVSQDDAKQYLKDLRSGDKEKRAIAAYMLGIIGKDNPKIKRALTKALRDKDWDVRKWAALSLGEIGERETELIPILMDIIRRDDSKEFRTHAVIILGELEKRAIPSISVLQHVREWTCWALNKIAGLESSNLSKYPEERPKLSDRLRVVHDTTKKKRVM
ncbi:MAG: HEAT repeat domain-containing protein [Candidatus Heimdallarchaeota archaeon]